MSLIAAATMVAVGAAGGFGAGPGSFAFTDTSASASFFNPADQSTQSVSVDRTLYLVGPGGKKAGAQQMTVLSVFIYVPDTDPNLPPVLDASGCFVIPDSAFVVSKDLGKATLNVTVNENNACPEFLSPVSDGAPAKGGGPGGGGFTFPLTVTGSWTGTGVIGKSDNHGVFRCGGFVSNTHTSSRSQFSAGMSVLISGFGTFSGRPPDAFGFVSSTDNRFDVNGTGVISPACGGKGG